MGLVRLNIDGISYSQTQNGAYALILSEVEGNRKLPIVIGASEAQSIAIALEKEIMPPRPLTHDLFKNFSDRFSIIITQVIIHKLVDGVFFSSIICEREGVEEIVDARTSDAIALALRFKAPIFSHKEILDSAGMFLKTGGKKEEKKELEDVVDEFLQNDDSKTPPTESQDYKTSTLKELNQLLEGAVKNEDYEIAAKIRDEISKRD